MLYEIKNLIKSYNGRVVLDLPAVSFQRGSIIGLLGPNGAGKTTLLEILGFLLAPTSGEVRHLGEKVDYGNSGIINLRQKVVLVQQKPILFSTTVYKNIEFPLKIRKKPMVERKAIIGDLLRMVGMEDFCYARALHLSGGETQRVAIAQALACSPEVILMDEPTASVDVENQIIIERIIRDINKEKGISVIFTTHDLIQAARIADETLFLFDGRVAKSIHENIFSGHIESDDRGDKYCVLPNDIRLHVQTDRTGPARISIRPDMVSILHSLKDPAENSSYKGRLLQLTYEQNRVRALIDVGLPISVLIPWDAFANMQMILGEDVLLQCPPESIEFF
ncbi:MAG: ATP-binding cassette domain-containing protein [Deltaproteobacteria bacterium]|nr:ATP-binding cassette domain-containing protein [Deltaproteobacteria bacterium]